MKLCSVVKKGGDDVLTMLELVKTQNMFATGLLAFVFLVAFSWGWKLAHGSVSS